jgi:hypothetical protein
MSNAPAPRFLRFATTLTVIAPLILQAACSTGEPSTGIEGGLPPGTGGTGKGAAGSDGSSGGSGGVGADGGTGGGSTGIAGSKTIMIDPGPGQGTAGTSGEMNCGAENHQAMIKPLAIYMLVDWSASMTERTDLWTPTKTALNTFVSDPGSAGIEVALSYFPVSSEDITVKCDATQYVTPSVDVAKLPENATPVTTSLDSKTFTLGEQPPPPDRLSTPTAPAISGSLQYFQGWLSQHPDHIGVLVLATDGEPAGCDEASMMAGMPITRGTPEELQQSVDLIAAAAAGTPAIKTYVIGLGNLQQALDQLAEAGGTGHEAFIVDASGTNTQTEFLEAMKEIRGAALPCSFDIPLPTMGPLDYTKVNVDFQTDMAAAKTPFFKVDDEAACAGSTTGWYYDDPLHPTTVELCPAACEAARSVETSSVSISLGCETRVL